MREMGPSFVTVAAQGFYRSGVRNCYPLPSRGKRISFDPHFFISQSALILLLLLSKSQPLRWVAIWFRRVAAFLFFHF